MGLRDYMRSFSRHEQEASTALLGELTPAEQQRLNSTQYDPEAVGDRVGDKTLLEADIIKSMGNRQAKGADTPDNMRDKLTAEFGRERPHRWEMFGGRQILPVVVERGKESGGTMDSEVKIAKQHVREREAAVWTRVEQIGRQARTADRAVEKAVPAAKADEETRKAGATMVP